MDEAPILGSNREQKIFNHVMALHGAPAFIRRAQIAQATWDLVVDRCRRQRDKWLGMVRTRLGMLRALAGQWPVLASLVRDGSDLEVLARLEGDLRPVLRYPAEPTTSPRRLRTALKELIASLEYFNQRWQEYLAAIDLTEVNRLRDNYNRYYVLEKECAVRSAAIARQGFQRLPPVAVDDLATLFPPLPEPLAA
jgi:hypothetical protein